MNRLIAVILVMPFLLPSCKEEAAPASDPSAAAGPAATAATQPSTREARDADRLKNRVEAFRFDVYYSFAHGSGPGRVSGVILSVPPATAPGPDRGPVDVRVLRITQAEAGRLIERLDTDGFLRRGRERAYVLGSVPPLPYYQIVASTGPWETYLSYARVGPEAHARLESLADALDDEGRNALRSFVQATAQRSNLKADQEERNAERATSARAGSDPSCVG